MSHPRIGMDVRMWRHPGIGRYLRELTRELIPLASDSAFCFLGYAKDRDEILSLHARSNLKYRVVRSPIYSVAEQIEIPRKAYDLDLLHVPHFNIPIFFNEKLIVTVHDLIYLYPEAHSLSFVGRAYAKWIFRVLSKKADAVLAVSQFTKDELLKFYPVLSNEKVSVTYEAVGVHFKKINDKSALTATKERLKLDKPFVLFVGSLKPHKNLATLVRAFSFFKAKSQLDHELILVGRSDRKNPSVLKQASQYPFVRHLGELSDEQLVDVYNLAELFVLPSFWEGFGLPVLEAMACGVPVVSSNRSSLPEVVGDAAKLFDPDRVDALSDVLYNVLMDKELRQKMSQDGLERVRQFSWQKTARQTLQVYRQVL